MAGYSLGTKAFDDAEPIPGRRTTGMRCRSTKCAAPPRPGDPEPAATFIAPSTQSAPIRLARKTIQERWETLRDPVHGRRGSRRPDHPDPGHRFGGQHCSAHPSTPCWWPVLASQPPRSRRTSRCTRRSCSTRCSPFRNPWHQSDQRFGADSYAEVPAGDLRPGDIVEVRSGEVVPPISASSTPTPSKSTSRH